MITITTITITITHYDRYHNDHNLPYQIADGLNYLHSQQIVHLDMKSPNVLAWEFPSPLLPRQERMEQAGNVWLKIADYGISQVSTSLMMKITTNPVGTPGYMAPELFESPGQEIFSTKVAADFV